MMTSQASSSFGGDLLYVGPFPGPVHGQSVATQIFADILSERLSLDSIDTAGGVAAKLRAHFEALRAIVRGSHRAVYLSINSNAGIELTSILATAARRAGKAIFLHHHSYRYIGQHGNPMARLVAAAGDEAVHICNCPTMGEELKAQYAGIKRVASLTNIGSVDTSLAPASREARPVTLGHMSNLTEEKGLGRVIEAFGVLRETITDARLHIAGPSSDEFSASALAEATKRFGDAFTYHGPVYGAEKQRFFDAIDIFCFPSLYAVETQGIVNLEAMACGKPVVAFDQCCIGADIGETGGRAVPKGGDYSAETLALGCEFLKDPALYSAKARARFDHLRGEYEDQLQELSGAILRASRGDRLAVTSNS